MEQKNETSNSRKRKLVQYIKCEISSDSDVDTELVVKREKLDVKKEKLNIKKGKQDVKKENIKKEKVNVKKEKLNVKEEKLNVKKERLNVKKEPITIDELGIECQAEDGQPRRKTQKKVNIPSSSVNNPYWEDYELLAEYQNLSLDISRNIVGLFAEDCTIPFIARYRKDVTDNMTPEALRDVKYAYDKIMALKARTQTVVNCMRKSANLDDNLEKAILTAKSIEEVEHIYAPFKPGGKRTLAERAKALGLHEPAQIILENNRKIDIYQYVDKSNSELDTHEKVEKGIVHIIAHVISTDIKVLTFLRKLKTECNFGVEVKKLAKRSVKAKTATKEPDESKYENYFNYKMLAQYMKPHQVLAINRGETQKILSVKVVVPEFISRKFTTFCKEILQYKHSDTSRRNILDEAIKDSYSRLMQPLLVREIRAALKQNAEKASYEVFCDNLKQLLLTPPIKGRAILGIDPGFSNGCKVGLISPTGALLTSSVFYLHGKRSGNEAKVLKDMLMLHNCSLIALGNGTACRETETWLSDLISNNYFLPLDVSYIIINENGASIYSCSPEAKKEFPTLDPNIISAVSLARRVQEPLAEFVKVEPKHLGVGMYQHDLPKKKLEEALDEVVSECVSFVGIDLNTASQCLLRRTAGLSDKRATSIIKYRDTKGAFLNRNELMKITGIGSKIFEQCAGFLRVGPVTVGEESTFYDNPNSNKLDCTVIHPEAYALTEKLVKYCKLKLANIGTAPFIYTIKERISSVNFKDLSGTFGAPEQTLKLIFDALAKPLNYDLRNDCSKVPLFKKGVTNLSDLQIGGVITGRVNNVTHFGSFVDIGVGSDGLIHISKMKGQSLQMGNIVEVRVLSVEIPRKRVGLELQQVI